MFKILSHYTALVFELRKQNFFLPKKLFYTHFLFVFADYTESF